MADLARLPDWRPRLEAWLLGLADRPFAWGSHDCALFAAGALEAMTGTDIAAPYRGRYSTLEEGLKLARGGHVAVFLRHLSPIAAALAQVGDIAVVGEVGQPALGLFDGETILVLREEGLGRLPRQAARRAMRVP